MSSPPQINGFKLARGFLTDGYEALQKILKELHSDIFKTSVLTKHVVCGGGADFASLFYNTNFFARNGAIPKRVHRTLLGEDGVQTLDGEQHRARKALFMSLMSADKLKQLSDLTGQYWREKGSWNTRFRSRTLR